MAGYSDTRQLIIDTLMGRPAGTEIQPEDHQAFALALNDYIRSVELVAGSGVPVAFAESDTVPVQPNNGQAVYLSQVPCESSVTFYNFINSNGQPITVTTDSNIVKLVTLIWNTKNWSVQETEIPVITDVSSNLGESETIAFSQKAGSVAFRRGCEAFPAPMGEEITTYSTIENKYITASGQLNDWANCDVIFIEVNEAESFYIKSFGSPDPHSLVSFAVYSSLDFNPTNLVLSGEYLNSTQIIPITIPLNGKYLALNKYTTDSGRFYHSVKSVDAQPENNSKNLVTSGGVFNFLSVNVDSNSLSVKWGDKVLFNSVLSRIINENETELKNILCEKGVIDKIYSKIGFHTSGLEEISLQKNQGAYINGLGNVLTGALQEYFYTQPIYLNEGWYILRNVYDYLKSISIISSCDENGENRKTILRCSNDNTRNITDYIYFLKEGWYMFSGANVSVNGTVITSLNRMTDYFGILSIISNMLKNITDHGVKIANSEENLGKINEKLFTKSSSPESPSVIYNGYQAPPHGLIPISNSDFTVHMFPVTPGEVVEIHASINAGDSYVWMFYSGSNASANEVVSYGIRARDSTKADYILSVPLGATYIGVQKWGSSIALYKNEFHSISQIYEEIDNLKNDLIYVDEYSSPTPYLDSIQHAYISSSNGSITNEVPGPWWIEKWDVSNVELVHIHNELNIGVAYLYAFYGDDFASSDSAILVGPEASQSTSSDYYMVVPPGAKYLGLTHFNDYGTSVAFGHRVSLKDYVSEISERVDVLEASNTPYFLNKYAYEYDGNGNLFVAYNDGNGEEITYWFKKCMANSLFTFYRVGYRTVNRINPSTDGISTGSEIVYINSTASDNIGPFSMTNGAWVGGNHHFPNETAEKLYLTAVCEWFKIFVNGNIIDNQISVKGIAENISIVVKNIIFDPGIAPSVDSDSLSTPLCDEYATYNINRKTIETALFHKFVPTTQNTISNYYGMQSVFVGEEFFMTPMGQFVDWESVEVTPSVTFSKISYPNFNRFIEKSVSRGTYQASFLESFGLGNHEDISSDSFIFNRSSGKDYHHLISSPYIQPLANAVIQWSGSYTFFHTPIVDDEFVFAYRGSIRGKEAIFVNAKKALKGNIEIPSDLSLKKISVLECFGIKNERGNEEFQIGGNGLYIESESSGSLIVVFD